MARLRLALVCALGVVLLTPQTATAGGWWTYIDLNRSTAAPGQRVEVDEVVTFSSAAAAEHAAEADRFYVYLLRDFDYSVVERAMRKPSPRNWWSLGGAEAIQVGRVAISVSDTNLARARAALTVPELPPATYHLMLCDAGCAEPLADVIPVKGFAVVADRAVAQIALRVERLQRRSFAVQSLAVAVRNQAGRLAAARANAGTALDAALDASSEVQQLEARNSPRVSRWAYVGWFVAGALVGALALLALHRRRSRPVRSARIAGWHPSDEELQELLRSEPGRSR
jgi:hypothetical protein